MHETNEHDWIAGTVCGWFIGMMGGLIMGLVSPFWGFLGCVAALYAFVIFIDVQKNDNSDGNES